MANEDSAILKEVDQELAEERQWAMFQKHGPLLLAGAAAIVLGVAGWQGWNHVKNSKAETLALEYRSALELMEEDREAGRTALAAVADEKGGYGALAALQRAGSYAAGGERLKAIEIYRSVANGDAPKRVRELAQLRAAYLSLADGRDQVMADLGGLAEAGGYFGFYAREVLALASLKAEDYESAQSSFRALSIEVGAPEGIRNRAEEFAALAAAGKAGVNITGEIKLDDLLPVMGDEADAATGAESETGPEADAEAGTETDAEPLIDDHAGHNHEE